MSNRYRTHKHQPRPLEMPDGHEFDLYLATRLPTYGEFRYFAEQAATKGVQATHAHPAADRRVDQPLWGQVAVMPRDERDARDGKPLAFLDARPGHVPIIIIGGGTMHWEELKEIADEKRHYGDDVLARDEAPPDIQADYIRRIEEGIDAQVGRKRFWM